MKKINKLLFLRFVLIVPVIEASLRIFGFNRTVFILSRFGRTKSNSIYPANDIKKHKDALFYYYQKFPFAGKCLARALSLWFLLKLKGIKTDIRFGMKKEKNKLVAHAWVEHNGKPLTIDTKVRQEYSLFRESVVIQK